MQSLLSDIKPSFVHVPLLGGPVGFGLVDCVGFGVVDCVGSEELDWVVCGVPVVASVV